MPDPEVFIDCMGHPLYEYAWHKTNPIINIVTKENRPKQDLTQMIANGRLEDRYFVIVATISLTIIGALVLIL